MFVYHTLWSFKLWLKSQHVQWNQVMISIILHIIAFYRYVHVRHLCITGTNCAILPKNELACRIFSDKLNKNTCMLVILLCLFVLLGFFGSSLYILTALVTDNQGFTSWVVCAHWKQLTVITQANDKNLWPPWSCPFPRKFSFLTIEWCEACPKPNNNDESLAMF